MDTLLISALVTIAAIIILAVTHKLSDGMKILTKVFLVIIVLLAILSIFIFNDIQDLKHDITKGKNLFILMDGESAVTAVGIKPSAGGTFDFDSFEYYNDTMLTKISDEISAEAEQIADSDRTFMLTPAIINTSYELDFGVMLDENDLLDIIRSNDTYLTLADKLGKRNEITKEYLSKNYGEPSKIKGYILAALIINYFQNSAGELPDHIKSGDLRVYPETISFKVLKYFPLPKLE